MFDWKSQLQEASFRGVKFFVDSHNYSVGRRNVVHQYPFQDEAYVEDLGQEADEFSITGYILQKKPLYNYFKDRDKLIEALKKKDPGILIHRYLGEKRVSLVGKASISERFSEGGIARFTMTFVEAGKNQYPAEGIDPTGAMDFAALDAINRAVDAFGEIYDTAQSVIDDVNGAMRMIKSAIRTIKSIPATVISEATNLVTNAASTLSAVANSPCDLANSITGAFDGFLFAAGMLNNSVDRAITGGCSGRTQNPSDAGRNSDQLNNDEGQSISYASAQMSTFGAVIGEDEVNPEFGGGVVKINVASPDSAASQSNRQATTNLIRLTGLAQATRIAVRTEYDSQDDVIANMQTIMDLIDAFLEYLGNQAGDPTLAAQGISFSNDEIYQSVNNLKPAFKNAMDTIGASLARNVNYEVGQDVITSLSLAYDKYEDLSRDKEIVSRNKGLIFYPGFLPNGKTISILSE